MDNVVSGDLPLWTEPGEEQLYLVTGSVCDGERDATYKLVVRARSNWTAGEQFGAWCRAQFGRPARMLLGVGTESIHKEIATTYTGAPRNSTRWENGRRIYDVEEQLFQAGVGAYRCMDEVHDTKADAASGEAAPHESPQQIVGRVVGAYAVLGKRYPQWLPDALLPWYVYTSDGGHCILVALLRQWQARESSQSIEDFLVPAPVRAVIRATWTSLEGYLLCDLPYDPELGLMCDEEDDEY